MRKLLPILVAMGSIAHADSPTPTIVISQPPTAAPQVSQLPDVEVATEFSQLMQLPRAPECAEYLSAAPVAILELEHATPQLNVSLRGDAQGIVLKLGQQIWTACSIRKQGATIGKISEGWQPGRYEVYAANRKHTTKRLHVELAVFDPDYISPGDAAAAPTGALELVLGDDATRPVSLKIQVPAGHPRWYPVTLRTTVKRKVVVVALGAGAHDGLGSEKTGHSGRQLIARNLGDNHFDGTVKPDRPLAFDVYGEGGTEVFVVAADAQATIATEHDVFGVPDGGRPRDRMLENFALFPHVAPLRSGVSRVSAELAGRLFTTLDPRFFLYVSDGAKCHFVDGEPLLWLHAKSFLHANGDVTECPAREDDLTTQRPAVLAMPKLVEPRTDQGAAIWHPEDFLAHADTDKQIAAYKATKDTARACNDKLWAQLDPDGKADNYDIVTYSHGKVDKIEGAGDRIFHKVYAACHLEAVEKQRDAIYARLAKTFKTEEQQRLDAIAQRFAAL